LYWKLDTYLQMQLMEIRSAAVQRDADEIPIFYFREWNRYGTARMYIQAITRYLDRHWTFYRLVKGQSNIYYIRTLSLVRWREDLLDIEKRIVPSILTLVERHRNGEVVDTSLIKTVVETFMVASVERAEKGEKKMDMYRSYFEWPFLEATRVFYRAESKQFLANRSIVEYARKVSYLGLSIG
jgi:cullin 1